MGVLTTDQREGEQVELLTQGSGPLRATVGAGGGGDSAPTLITVPSTGPSPKEFDGIGGSNFLLGPVTIVENAATFSGTQFWDFLPDGVGAGWVVFFAINSPQNQSSPPSVVISNDGNVLATLDSGNAPASNPTGFPYAIYFDGTNWKNLSSRLGAATV